MGKTRDLFKKRIGHRYIEVFNSSQEGVRSYLDPPLKFMSVQLPGPCDHPGTARRYTGIIKQAGLERMRSGATVQAMGVMRSTAASVMAMASSPTCLRETSVTVSLRYMTTGIEMVSSLSRAPLDTASI